MVKRYSACKRRLSRKAVLALAVILAACLGLATLSACGPQTAADPPLGASATGDVTEEADDPASSVTVVSPTGASAGLLPTNEYNKAFINAGSRGCNTCHGDLGAMMENSGLDHIKIEGEYGKPITIADCLPCHRQHWVGSGPYYGDMLHERHYSSDAFTGNCWNCHAQDSSGEVGEYQWELWDEYKYTASLGGFPDDYYDERVQNWLKQRGASATGTMSNIALDSEPNLQVELSQEVKDEDDLFVLNNYGTCEVDASQWALEVTGVANERSFTLEDLRAMPQTEMTVTQVCFTSSINSPFAGNIPVKGVLLSDLIEACGGLANGTNAFACAGADGWATAYAISLMTDNNAMIALEYFGHDLTADQGYPATLVIPGAPGAPWVKHIVSMGGQEWPAERLINSYAASSDGITSHKVNSAWFQNDGVTGKVGEPLELTGYGFAWSGTDLVAPLATLSFSFDYGDTWTDVSIPVDADPYQWSTFAAAWTPQAPGTYVAWLKAVNADGYEQEVPSGLFVVVEE